jgi:hypothetical protein
MGRTGFRRGDLTARFWAPQASLNLLAWQIFVASLAMWLTIYCPWGVLADVPDNYHRWQEEVGRGARWFSFHDGLKDAWGTLHVTHKLADWKVPADPATD